MVGYLLQTGVNMLTTAVRGVLFASVPMMRDMFRFIEEKQIRPKIAKTFAWQEARDAFKLLVDQDFVGKIAVRVD